MSDSKHIPLPLEAGSKFSRLLFAILLFCFIRTASAQSDDITLMGKIDPLYILEKAFSESVTTSEQETLNIGISDIAVESERVLVRFFASDLPDRWKNKVTDPQRLYGSYLPIAELVPGDGSILTPSSASKFSLLEYNSRLIIGGMLVFPTDKAPQAFFLNFNQLPFDTRPLAEGFTKEIRLVPADPAAAENRPATAVSDTHGGLEFTLASTAQTADVIMAQPAVRMEREDEILSKFGWITVSDTQSGKRFGVTRDNIYGFNLADDSLYAPAHAYYFAHENTDRPFRISMDHAYVVRSYTDPDEIVIGLEPKGQPTLLDDGDLHLKLTGVQPMPEGEKIRLYIGHDGPEPEDLSFLFETLNGTTEPPVYCGIDIETHLFACDIYFHEHSFPASELRFRIDAVEYKKEGPWEITWTPVPAGKAEAAAQPEPAFPDINRFTERYHPEKEQPMEVQTVLDRLQEQNRLLTKGEGWIHEQTSSVYHFSSDYKQDLIPASQISSYLTDYQTDIWYRIAPEGQVSQIITVIRDTASGEVRSALMQEKEENLDLLHALRSKNNGSFEKDYKCFRDFRELAGSSASFLSSEPCEADAEGMICVSFSQSLNGIPDSPERQLITFRIDPDSGMIRNETIIYGDNMLNLLKTFSVPEKTDCLPDDILALVDSIE